MQWLTPPVITQGAGPLTKTVIEDGSGKWTTAELDATDVDTAVGALTWSVSTPASNGTANVSGSGARRPLYLSAECQL